MFAIDPGHAAMAVTHVFAKTNVSDRDQVRALLFDRAQGFLDDAVLRVSAAGLFVFDRGDAEKQNGLEAGVLGATRFIDNFFERELKNTWHARDRAARVNFFADEEWKNEVVWVEISFADEVAKRGGTSQATRAMEESPHELRVLGTEARAKSRLPMITERRYSFGNGASGQLLAHRYQQLVYEDGLCVARAARPAPARRHG